MNFNFATPKFITPLPLWMCYVNLVFIFILKSLMWNPRNTKLKCVFILFQLLMRTIYTWSTEMRRSVRRRSSVVLVTWPSYLAQKTRAGRSTTGTADKRDIRNFGCMCSYVVHLNNRKYILKSACSCEKKKQINKAGRNWRHRGYGSALNHNPYFLVLGQSLVGLTLPMAACVQ